MVIKKEVVNFFKIFSEKLSRLVGFRNFSFFKALTPRRLIEIVYILLFFLFTGGIVNSYLEGSDPVFFSRLIVPGLRVQNLLESLIYLFAGSIGIGGIGGIFLMYVSRKQIEKRVENLYLFFGLLILLMSVFIYVYVVEVKIGRIG
jgi:hypothetical protein